MARERKLFCSVVATILLLVATMVKAQKQPAHKAGMPAKITCIDALLPVTFSWIDYEQEADEVPVVVGEKIQQIIVDLYLETGGDSTEEYAKGKAAYFNTIRVPYNNLDLFIVILKTPLSYPHCKLFLFDSTTNMVSKKTIDYNIWAMYSIDDNTITRSNLLNELHIDGNDIVQAGKTKTNLRLKRLKHNGTNNELEEVTYRANGLSLDTVSFKLKKLDD